VVWSLPLLRRGSQRRPGPFRIIYGGIAM